MAVYEILFRQWTTGIAGHRILVCALKLYPTRQHFLIQHLTTVVPSMLWRCWLGSRKGIRPVKNWVVGCWRGYIWSEVQTCIWPSWCHCHSLSFASVQEAQLSPSDRAMHLVSSNLANYHAIVQKLLIRQVLTKPMVLSWRFSWRQCDINKPTTVELCISPVYRRLAVAKFSKSTM